MGKAFQSLSPAEKRAFLEAAGQRHVGIHRVTGTIGRNPPMPWKFCVQCGLLALKNDVTRRALRAACVWEE